MKATTASDRTDANYAIMWRDKLRDARSMSKYTGSDTHPRLSFTPGVAERWGPRKKNWTIPERLLLCIAHGSGSRTRILIVGTRRFDYKEGSAMVKRIYRSAHYWFPAWLRNGEPLPIVHQPGFEPPLRSSSLMEKVVREHTEWLKGEMENAVYQATGIQSHDFTIKLKERYRILDKAAMHLRERAREHGVEVEG